MNRALFATLGLVAIFIAGACSSATEEKPSAKTNSTTNNNANSATVQDGTEVSASQAADPNAANAPVAGPLEGPAANRLRGKLDAMRAEAADPVDNAKVEAMARKNARPAPDNSTLVSFLTDAGYEIRTFKSHPQLLRVEKKVTAESQTIKVFLRNGRVVDLPGDAISVGNASAGSILAAAGVQQNPAPKSDTARSADQKKPGN